MKRVRVKAALDRELNLVKAELGQLESGVGGGSTAVAASASSDRKHGSEEKTERPRIQSVKITTYGTRMNRTFDDYTDMAHGYQCVGVSWVTHANVSIIMLLCNSELIMIVLKLYYILFSQPYKSGLN